MLRNFDEFMYMIWFYLAELRILLVSYVSLPSSGWSLPPSPNNCRLCQCLFAQRHGTFPGAAILAETSFSFPSPAHLYGGVPKPSSAPPPPKAMTPEKWLEEAEQMGELIATFMSRRPHFAFDDNPSLPYPVPESTVWVGPGWQKKKKRTATRLEAQCWRTELRLLSH